MNQSWKYWWWTFAGIIGIGGVFAFWDTAAVAQITPDTSLGTENSLVTPNVDIQGLPADLIEGGATRDAALFHSFSEFNVGEGLRVYFANPVGIETIFSRVTGSDVSNILGTLGVDGGASLFLLNPNGIIFGENARLDIAGSFVASTANSVVFENGVEFSATNPEAPPLLTINLTPGLQYGSNSNGRIANAGNLGVGVGETLSLYGNTVTSTGRLTAPGGTVQILGDRVGLFENAQIDVSSDMGGGTVLIGIAEEANNLYIPSVTHANRTFVSPDAIINANGIGNSDGGNVLVWSDEATRFYGTISARGGEMSGNGGFVEVSGKDVLEFDGLVDTTAANGRTGTLLLDPTNIEVVVFANETDNLNDVDGFADPDIGADGDTKINATAINNAAADVVLQATNNIIFNAAVNIRESGIGLTAQAGNTITVNRRIATPGGDIQLIGGITSNHGSIFINDDVRSRGGDIVLQAGGDIVVEEATVNTESGFLGDSGDMTIETGRLILQNKGQVDTSTFGWGNAGNLDVRATEIEMTESVNASSNILTGIGAATRRGSTGNAGKITIETERLTARNGAQVLATTSGSGKAGEIIVRASEIELIGDFPLNGFPSGILANNQPGSTGASGKITIETERLIARDGAGVYVSTFTGENGGELTVQASEIELTGTGKIYPSALSAQAHPRATGNAGQVTIETDRLIAGNGGTITTASTAGNGGNQIIKATDFIDLANGGSLVANAAAGFGGTISIETKNLTLENGGIINTSTTGQGDAGSIAIRQSESVTVDKGSVISSLSFGSGIGGNLLIETGTLTIRDGSGVITSTAGQGSAGNLTVQAKNSVNVIRDGLLSTGTLGTGTGGNLLIETRSLNVQDKGKVFSSSLDASTFDLSSLDPNLYSPDLIERIRNNVNIAAQGNFTQGDSGNLNVIATDSVNVANNGVISTQGRGEASGGDLTINTQELTVDNAGAIVTDTFGSGNSGNLTINANDTVNVIGFGSDITTQTRPDSIGNGGSLTITTGQLRIEDEAAVSSGTFGQGVGGDIQLQGNSLELANRGRITSRSEGLNNAGNIFIRLNDELRSRQGQVVATSLQFGGGNIDITAQDILLRNSSLISTSVFDSTGGGGNIQIKSNSFVALEDSDILANADAGPGGDIIINSSVFLADLFASDRAIPVGRNPGDLDRFRRNGEVDISVDFAQISGNQPVNVVDLVENVNRFRINERVDISADSRTGRDGSVTTPVPFFGQGLTALPTNFVDAERLIDRSCNAGGAALASSFIFTGRGGIPPSPLDVLESDIMVSNWVSLDEETPTQTQPESVTPNSAKPRQIIEAQGWVRLANGQIVLVAESPTVTPQGNWQNTTDCEIPESK